MKTSGFNVNGFLLMENFIQSIFSLNLFQMVDLHLKKKYFELIVSFEAIFWVVRCYENILEGLSFFFFQVEIWMKIGFS